MLLVHNVYQQRGGEDAVVDAEEALLRSRGHEVRRYERHNEEIDGGVSRLKLLQDTVWSRRTTRETAELFLAFQPQVVHVHNTFPLVSPSIYWAAHRASVPVVQTLHNFRLICPQGFMLREHRVCSDCVGRVPWPAVLHSCYRGSALQSAALGIMLQSHRTLGTWDRRVTLYIALNAFCLNYFERAGFPGERIRLKPNFCKDPGPINCSRPRQGLLFVGRLSAEKGVDVLLKAHAHCPELALRIVGDGPMAQQIEVRVGLTLDGKQPPSGVLEAMRSATALIVPSIWPEMFGLVVIEAYAAGLPVIASRIGALAELVEDGVTGLLVAAGDPADLASKMLWATEHPVEMARMGAAARQRYERSYTPTANVFALESLYRDAMRMTSRETK